MRKAKIYPSSAAWALGKMIYTDTPQGCLRYILLQRYIPKFIDIDPKFKEIGNWGEEQYLDYMLNEQDYPFHRELPFKSELNGIQVSGRMDFISYHDGFKVIHECKTTQSKNVLYQNMRKNEPKLNHMAQLVFYLINQNETRGKLVYRFWPTNELKIFKIEIEPSGQILVDKKPYKLTVNEQMTHQILSAEVLTEEYIADKPYGSGCRFCDYKEECEKFDSVGGSHIDDFMEVINV